MYPKADIAWIAGSPAAETLAEAGEKLAPEQAEHRGETDLEEAAPLSQNFMVNSPSKKSQLV